MISVNSHTGKVTATEPILKVPKVRYAVNAAHLIHQENAQHGAKTVSNVETEIISVCVVGPGKEKIPKTETNKD